MAEHMGSAPSGGGDAQALHGFAGIARALIVALVRAAAALRDAPSADPEKTAKAASAIARAARDARALAQETETVLDDAEELRADLARRLARFAAQHRPSGVPEDAEPEGGASD